MEPKIFPTSTIRIHIHLGPFSCLFLQISIRARIKRIPCKIKNGSSNAQLISSKASMLFLPVHIFYFRAYTPALAVKKTSNLCLLLAEVPSVQIRRISPEIVQKIFTNYKNFKKHEKAPEGISSGAAMHYKIRNTNGMRYPFPSKALMAAIIVKTNAKTPIIQMVTNPINTIINTTLMME